MNIGNAFLNPVKCTFEKPGEDGDYCNHVSLNLVLLLYQKACSHREIHLERTVQIAKIAQYPIMVGVGNLQVGKGWNISWLPTVSLMTSLLKGFLTKRGQRITAPCICAKWASLPPAQITAEAFGGESHNKSRWVLIDELFIATVDEGWASSLLDNWSLLFSIFKVLLLPSSSLFCPTPGWFTFAMNYTFLCLSKELKYSVWPSRCGLWINPVSKYAPESWKAAVVSRSGSLGKGTWNTTKTTSDYLMNLLMKAMYPFAPFTTT